MRDHLIRVLASIAAIVVLECVAMATGIDGKCFGLAIALIAGLGGFALAKVQRP